MIYQLDTLLSLLFNSFHQIKFALIAFFQQITGSIQLSLLFKESLLYRQFQSALYSGPDSGCSMKQWFCVRLCPVTFPSVNFSLLFLQLV